MRLRAALLGVIALTVTPSVQAARAPRSAERAAILAATRTYIDTSNCCAIITRIKVYSVRVSTVDPRWALLHLNGYDASGHNVGAVSAALHKGNLTNRWAVRNFGTSDLGCDMPRRVQRDLGEDCPG
jgi:hypothetical protein